MLSDCVQVSPDSRGRALVDVEVLLNTDPKSPPPPKTPEATRSSYKAQQEPPIEGFPL